MDRLRITADALEVEEIVAAVGSSKAGGVAVFLGTTREDVNERGRKLIALDYEAYAEMAERQLGELAKRARERWPVVNLCIEHRVGRVKLGEPSVVIAVSTPHRAEAFAVCEWLIDSLKKEVAIWKKEVWAE